MNLRPQVILDPRCAHTCTQPSCPPQPLHKCIFKHHPAWTFFLQLTEYLRSDMLTSTPVDLFRFSSWDTTTCSSFVRWQSSSSMSVPKLTALEMKKLSLNNTWILHRYKPNTGYCIKLIPLEVLEMLSDAMKPHSLAAKQEANNSAAAGELDARINKVLWIRDGIWTQELWLCLPWKWSSLSVNCIYLQGLRNPLLKHWFLSVMFISMSTFTTGRNQSILW